ncbi:MAG: hypothetical protein BroJett040_11610 [Oligoflexia bacterium]|nr:MAG: hypothetical protein BroJett040_11610 [Oligoflexia bacterium]
MPMQIHARPAMDQTFEEVQLKFLAQLAINPIHTLMNLKNLVMATSLLVTEQTVKPAMDLTTKGAGHRFLAQLAIMNFLMLKILNSQNYMDNDTMQTNKTVRPATVRIYLAGRFK